MEKFRNFLNELDNVMSESPQKMTGDAPFEEVGFKMISSRSNRIVEMDFNLVTKNFLKVDNEELDLYSSKTHPYYILGRFYHEKEEEVRFATIFDISFRVKKNFRSNHKQLKNKDVIVIDTVHTAKDYRGKEISQTVYEHILKKYIIISDKLQYEGAVNLWKNLIKNNVVYIYNILEDKIISKVSPNTPESHIWTDDSSKQRIRLVMIPN